jgi:hypothetical protein
MKPSQVVIEALNHVLSHEKLWDEWNTQPAAAG